MYENHGKMPVWALDEHDWYLIQEDDRHCVMTTKTHLHVLGDIFVVPLTDGKHFMTAEMSLGDLLLFLGSFIAALAYIVPFVFLGRGIRSIVKRRMKCEGLCV